LFNITEGRYWKHHFGRQFLLFHHNQDGVNRVHQAASRSELSVGAAPGVCSK
jgi:hypothetical protein